MVEITQYAPVIIPTLNRFVHFKRCLESLEKCTGADKTDVYIGLDFPPSDGYKEGWEKINEYLKEKVKHHSFNHLFVRRREKNCGVGNPNSNMMLLIREVEAISDIYISSEDDNEFAPCFLDFMNKGLEYYKDDPRVFTISGFNQYCVKDKSMLFTYDNSGWGMGRWRNRHFPTIVDTRDCLSHFKTIRLLFYYYPALLYSTINSLKRGKVYGDATLSCYCIAHDCYQLRPAESLVRNWGHDGSGEHCSKSDRFVNMVLSNQETFLFPKIEPLRTKEIDSLVRNNMMPKSRKRYLRFLARIIVISISYCLNNR